MSRVLKGVGKREASGVTEGLASRPAVTGLFSPTHRRLSDWGSGGGGVRQGRLQSDGRGRNPSRPTGAWGPERGGDGKPPFLPWPATRRAWLSAPEPGASLSPTRGTRGGRRLGKGLRESAARARYGSVGLGARPGPRMDARGRGKRQARGFALHPLGTHREGTGRGAPRKDPRLWVGRGRRTRGGAAGRLNVRGGAGRAGRAQGRWSAGTATGAAAAACQARRQERTPAGVVERPTERRAKEGAASGSSAGRLLRRHLGEPEPYFAGAAGPEVLDEDGPEAPEKTRPRQRKPPPPDPLTLGGGEGLSGRRFTLTNV